MIVLKHESSGKGVGMHMRHDKISDQTNSRTSNARSSLATLASQIDQFTSQKRRGKARTAILLWLLGIPLPLILVFFLIRGCMGG